MRCGAFYVKEGDTMANEGQPVLIPYPIKLGRNSGVYSLAANGTMTSFRIHNNDFKLLQELADELGVHHTALCRWFVVHGIQAIIHQHTGEKPEVVP
jgi:hypothetical protein